MSGIPGSAKCEFHYTPKHASWRATCDHAHGLCSSGLPAGTSFAVTVQTQPSGKICSVSNGSGAIAIGSSAANVTSVQVICAPSIVMSFTTPGPVIFTVPGGVTSLQVVATGGGGGGGSGNNSGGGSGGVVSATLAVTSGELIELFVGGGGSSGPSGGGSAGGNGSITITFQAPPI
jgi:hypothetical protein